MGWFLICSEPYAVDDRNVLSLRMLQLVGTVCDTRRFTVLVHVHKHRWCLAVVVILVLGGVAKKKSNASSGPIVDGAALLQPRWSRVSGLADPSIVCAHVKFWRASVL